MDDGIHGHTKIITHNWPFDQVVLRQAKEDFGAKVPPNSVVFATFHHQRFELGL